jgi:hypothetical protein
VAKAPAKSKPKSRVNEAGNYTKPTMRKGLFNKIKAGGKGARRANGPRAKLRCWPKSTRLRAGGIRRESPPEEPKKWGDEDWGTKSGKPSTQGPKATASGYLPKKARESLSAAEYAATSRAKREGTRKASNLWHNQRRLRRRPRRRGPKWLRKKRLLRKNHTSCRW